MFLYYSFNKQTLNYFLKKLYKVMTLPINLAIDLSKLSLPMNSIRPSFEITILTDQRRIQSCIYPL